MELAALGAMSGTSSEVSSDEDIYSSYNITTVSEVTLSVFKALESRLQALIERKRRAMAVINRKDELFKQTLPYKIYDNGGYILLGSVISGFGGLISGTFGIYKILEEDLRVKLVTDLMTNESAYRTVLTRFTPGLGVCITITTLGFAVLSCAMVNIGEHDLKDNVHKFIKYCSDIDVKAEKIVIGDERDTLKKVIKRANQLIEINERVKNFYSEWNKSKTQDKYDFGLIEEACEKAFDEFQIRKIEVSYGFLASEHAVGNAEVIINEMTKSLEKEVDRLDKEKDEDEVLNLVEIGIHNLELSQ